MALGGATLDWLGSGLRTNAYGMLLCLAVMDGYDGYSIWRALAGTEDLQYLHHAD